MASHTGPAAFNRGTPSNRRRGRCPHRPAVRSGCFFRPAQGGRHPRRPVIDANAPTFQNMSGSGAEWQTILHLGHVLPKIPRIDRKGSQETNGFLRRSLVTFFRRRKKVPRQFSAAEKNGRKRELPSVYICCGKSITPVCARRTRGRGQWPPPRRAHG